MKIGGFALQRKDSFEEEFERIVRGIGDAGAASARTGRWARVVNWARISSVTFDVTLWLYLAAMVLSFAYLAVRTEALWVAACVVAIAGVTANVVSIVARGLAAGRVPWGNMFEYSTVPACLVVFGTIVLVEGRADQDAHGLRALMFAVFTLAVAAMFFPVDPGPLQPALNSYWIRITSWPRSSDPRSSRSGDRDDPVPRDGSTERRALASRERAPAPIMGGAVELDAPHDLLSDPEGPGISTPSPRAAASCRPPPRSTASRTARSRSRSRSGRSR